VTVVGWDSFNDPMILAPHKALIVRTGEIQVRTLQNKNRPLELVSSLVPHADARSTCVAETHVDRKIGVHESLNY
jgi:hypothetical protein